MQNPVLSKKHIKEYFEYGGAAAMLFCLPVWYFLVQAEYQKSWVVYGGCILFMFIIMIYSIVLTRRRQDYKSAVQMLMAGHLALVTGIVLAVVVSCLFCFIYIPGFMSGDSADNFLHNAPEGLNHDNTGTLFQVFLPATVGNFGAGAFINVVVSYVLKPDQTKDKPAVV